MGALLGQPGSRSILTLQGMRSKGPQTLRASPSLSLERNWAP